MRGKLVTLGFCSLATAAAAVDGDLRARFENEVQPFLEEYCIDCHADGTSKGDFSFDDFDGVVRDGRTGDRWHEVINVLNEGRMPPEDEFQPLPEEKVAVVDWVGEELERAERALAGSGRGVLRRINRREYEHTIEGLLGVPPVGTGSFAKDGTVEGLDNQGQGLFMSPYQMERYLDSALATLEIALPAEEPEPLRLRIEGEDLKYEPHDFVYAGYRKDQRKAYERALARYEKLSDEEKKKKDPPDKPHPKELKRADWGVENDPPIEVLEDRGTVVYHPINSRAQLIIAGAKLMVPLEVPQDGWYRIRVGAGVGPETKWDRSTVTIGLYEFVGGKGGAQNMGHNPVFIEEVRGTIEDPETFETVVFLKAGKRRYYLHKGNLGWETDVYDQPDMWDMLNNRQIPRREFWRGMLVESFEIEGPVVPEEPRELLFPGGLEAPYTTEKARAALTRFASRAFRRPLEPGEVEPYLRFVDGTDRTTFLRGLQRGVAMVLSSPKFIYLVADSADSGQLDAHELATRLAYFLWNEGPDAELLELADRGELDRREVLLAQVSRMLDDPRSSRAIRAFASGWLGLDRLGGIVPDRRRYPRATFDMPATLAEQTTSFVEHILRADRSALEVIDSDWDMLNAKLARYYGLDHLEIRGTEMRPVELAGEDRRRRGGVMAHGSILTMTSNGTRTSPIVRGAWVVDHLLGDPAPPPPPSVAALEEVGVDDLESISVKELIELHKRDPNCAACHDHFDPYGVAFENYDAAGQWRDFHVKFLTTDRGNKTYRRKQVGPIDATGELADGTRFDGPAEMKALLMARKDEFARNLVSKLLAYALGRPVEFSDRPEVRRLERSFAESDYRLRPLIQEIVLCETFRRR